MLHPGSSPRYLCAANQVRQRRCAAGQGACVVLPSPPTARAARCACGWPRLPCAPAMCASACATASARPDQPGEQGSRTPMKERTGATATWGPAATFASWTTPRRGALASEPNEETRHVEELSAVPAPTGGVRAGLGTIFRSIAGRPTRRGCNLPSTTPRAPAGGSHASDEGDMSWEGNRNGGRRRPAC